jgi:hypothetical protein
MVQKPLYSLYVKYITEKMMSAPKKISDEGFLLPMEYGIKND